MKLAVLGSTGSVGINTLAVAKHLGLEVVALAARSNIEALRKQIEIYRPEIVAVYNEEAAYKLMSQVDVPVLVGEEGLLAVAERGDVVMAAMVGSVGIRPVVHAVRLGKRVALANKETLVMAGAYVMHLAGECDSEIIPVDSEHSALFQCLANGKKEEVKRLILTASGGPFRERKNLESVTLEEALNHPTWSMGPKITIDSSTLMNKGLEVIEAHHLFGMPLDQIDVVVHPQSVVHSMVEYVDGSTISHLSPPDMKLPIQYALTYPHRINGLSPSLDWTKPLSFDFFPPDKERFPCLNLAYQAAKEGHGCILNAANEVVVDRFLSGGMRWSEIAPKIERVMQKMDGWTLKSLDEHFAADVEARALAQEI